MKLLYSYHEFLGAVGRDVTHDEAYGVERPTPTDPRGPRPWVGMCMVASIDGSTIVGGNSRALSCPTDLGVLLALRRVADTILVGAQTARVDGYEKPAKEGQRIAVVSRSGRVDTTTALFSSGAGYMVTPDADGNVDLFATVAAAGGRFIQLEGGARLNAAMVDADLVDEINLTISPNIAGGDAPRLTNGAKELMRRYTLHHVLEHEGFLFLRYLRGG
ncbi:MAG: dihydrofolate reductase family protein [Acidobacteria bacterium]|nr:dihydrofolate reductase family protein [Acidobacteriota bacterium]